MVLGMADPFDGKWDYLHRSRAGAGLFDGPKKISARRRFGTAPNDYPRRGRRLAEF
jgi:hypothetical protein